MVDTYVTDRLKILRPDVTKVEVKVNRSAQIVTFSVEGRIGKRKMFGFQKWTDMELWNSDHPVTQLIEQVVRKVFEVPLEGTSVS
jgi:hypothetical protein